MLDDPLSSTTPDSQPDTLKNAVEQSGKLDRQARFLMAFMRLGRVTKAAEEAKISRETHYDWMRSDPTYAAEFRKAEEVVTGQMEDEAYRRAVEGTLKPVTIAGVRVDVNEFSDTLLIFLLKARRPDKYREHFSHEHTGKDGAPLMPMEAWDALFKAARETKQPSGGV